jgi:heme exporter protein C
MLYPLIVMLAAFATLFVALWLAAIRAEIYRRRIRAAELISARPSTAGAAIIGEPAPVVIEP